MNRTVFSLPERSEFAMASGLTILRTVEHFHGNANRLDALIDLLDIRRGVVLSSGTTVPGRYESFDLGFADPPLVLETNGVDFALSALNARGKVLIAFLGDTLREPCVVISGKTETRLAGHVVRDQVGHDPLQVRPHQPSTSGLDAIQDATDEIRPADERRFRKPAQHCRQRAQQVSTDPAGHRAPRPLVW